MCSPHDGIPVAQARAFDDTGRIIPQAYAVLDFVAGATRFAANDSLATARHMAEILAAIHEVNVTAPSFPALPNQVDRMNGWVISDLDRRDADASLREDLVRRHLDRHWPPSDSETRLLHADYFPGNIVWHDDRIAAVIDWESAASGTRWPTSRPLGSISVGSSAPRRRKRSRPHTWH